MSSTREEDQHIHQADLIAEELEEIRAKELTMVRTDLQARQPNIDWWRKRDAQLLDLVVDLIVTGRVTNDGDAFLMILEHLQNIPRSVITQKVADYRQIAPW